MHRAYFPNVTLGIVIAWQVFDTSDLPGGVVNILTGDRFVFSLICSRIAFSAGHFICLTIIILGITYQSISSSIRMFKGCGTLAALPAVRHVVRALSYALLNNIFYVVVHRAHEC